MPRSKKGIRACMRVLPDTAHVTENPDLLLLNNRACLFSPFLFSVCLFTLLVLHFDDGCCECEPSENSPVVDRHRWALTTAQRPTDCHSLQSLTTGPGRRDVRVAVLGKMGRVDGPIRQASVYRIHHSLGARVKPLLTPAFFFCSILFSFSFFLLPWTGGHILWLLLCLEFLLPSPWVRSLSLADASVT